MKKFTVMILSVLIMCALALPAGAHDKKAFHAPHNQKEAMQQRQQLEMDDLIEKQKETVTFVRHTHGNLKVLAKQQKYERKLLKARQKEERDLFNHNYHK